MYFLFSFLFVLFFLCFSFGLDPYLGSNQSVNIYKSWSNNLNHSMVNLFFDGFTIAPIIIGGINVYTSTRIVFGFFNNRSTSENWRNGNFHLVISLIPLVNVNNPVIVWCANRDKPVRENATLHFTAKKGLELKDVDGTLVWSTNTSGHLATRLDLSNEGNLMLLNDMENVIWQSFDYPTDTWLPHQNISSFKGRLTSSNSSSDLASGLYSLSLGPNKGLSAFINSDPAQIYLSLHPYDYLNIEVHSNYALFKVSTETNTFQYIRLEPNGHLNLYKMPNYQEVNGVCSVNECKYPTVNLFKEIGNNECAYPTTCGNYGVCSNNGVCSCPGGNSSYFMQSDVRQPNLGCRPVTILTCENKNHHSFLELENVSYFNLEPLHREMDMESCKRACLENCTCEAAFFSSGNCSLQSKLLSLKHVPGSDSLAFIKVQNRAMHHKINSSLVAIRVSTLLGGIVIILAISGYCYKIIKNSSNNNEEEGDDQVSAPLKRFSFLELKSATVGFKIKLGRGGFGCVFKGELVDGTKLAVKRLDSNDQGRKEFLAEVNTIGNIHHFNLVRLIGYCAERSNKLLVYEQMPNGSLDKWIFGPDNAINLVWEVKKKIITGLAKGLEYLHIYCNPCIIHFDIKPQNILLDKDFNVKIADFGLAKLIDRDQSQVITALKGTLGYLAPELFNGTNISVKADVFSFGVVLLEIIFGRKNLDRKKSCPLIDVVKEKVENNQLQQLVDDFSQGTELEKQEAMKMIKIGMWCLQAHSRRPSISTVLKVLEGLVELESVIEFNNLTTQLCEEHGEPSYALTINSAPLDASILSGPR